MNQVRAILALGFRQLRRDFAAGDIRILVAALVLAVVAVTSVGFITDRAQRALSLEANRLLGGDAVLRGDASIGASAVQRADALGLRYARTVELTSMLRAGEGLRLGDVRALGTGFPLRGHYEITTAQDAGPRTARAIPERGTLWLTRAGAERLGANIGDRIGVGDASLILAALVTQEPDAALDYFDVAPKAFVNLEDLPATGLVQEGSRLTHRLVVAGNAAAVARFVEQTRATLARGQRLETAADARPEIRSALDRASRFLGLAALVSVVLAAIAVAMAARRHTARHLQGAAVMRCIGASQRTIVGIHVGELLWLGLASCLLGLAIAFALQWAVGAWLANALDIGVPAAGLAPALEGLAVGLVVLMAFAVPPVLALRRVPALRVLRRETDGGEPSAWVVAIAGLAGIAALLWWKAGSAVLGNAMLVGIGGTLLVLALLAWGLILVVRVLRPRLRGPLRYGLANVARRSGSAIAQVAALGLGLMALLLLTLVRTDLLERWQLELANDAPNRFIINAQPDQVEAIEGFVKSRDLVAPTLWPLVRARLIERNGRAISGDDYSDSGDVEGDDTARRWVEREFNLSSAGSLREDNRITAGRLWPARGPASPEFSVEEGFAQRLGWKLGDRIAFDVAGQRLEARITSLRSVEWESFKPNFFVVASPGALEGYAASYITAVRVPDDDAGFTRELVERFPNLSVIDIQQVLTQVRATADQVSKVVEVVFYFALAAGVLVLLAAISASQDERMLEGGVMRALGASRAQLRWAQASEFAAIGLLSGLVAAIAASVLAGVVATRVFDLEWQADWRLAAIGGALGLVAAVGAGLIATRRVVDASPLATLREFNA